MKTLLLVSIIVSASTAFVIFQNSPAFASCTVNEDWPDAPCFDTLPISREEYRAAWAPYYNYKGSEWMEQKKAELLEVIEDETFMEWEGSFENSNVYNYYHSIGVVSNQYDYFFFEDEAPYRQYMEPNLGLFFVIVGIVSGAVGAWIFIIERK